MALKLVWRFVITVSKDRPDVYRTVSSAKSWIKESPAARATSLIYTEKRVSPMKLALMRTTTGKEGPELPLLQMISSLELPASEIAAQIHASEFK